MPRDSNVVNRVVFTSLRLLLDYSLAPGFAFPLGLIIMAVLLKLTSFTPPAVIVSGFYFIGVVFTSRSWF